MPNVVLLVVDTLRYDHVGSNGNPWIQTPNFDRFAQQSTVFENNYCASYPTVPHRLDVMTGRYGAPFHGWTPLPFGQPTLPQTLAQHGYVTQLIFDCPHLINGGHNFDFPFHAWHFERGNEVDRHWIDDSDLGVSGPHQQRYYGGKNPFQLPQYIRNNRNMTHEEDWPSPRLFDSACRWLEDNRRRDNFFLWVDCFDPHEPWDPPEHYVDMYGDWKDYQGSRTLVGWEDPGALTEEETRRVKAHYAGEVSMVDRWFGRFLDRLDDLGLSDNTAVIVTSDHGTNLGARGKLMKSYPLYEQVSHTVLMVRLPGQKQGTRVRGMVQPQDIFPTIMDIVGQPTPDWVEGQSLLPVLDKPHANTGRKVAVSGAFNVAYGKGQPVLTVQNEDWCLLDSPDPALRELYHKTSDPAQERNVLDTFPKVYEELHTALISELENRGASPQFIEYLVTGDARKLEGLGDMRAHYPDGYRVYFMDLYQGE